ncbi:class I SAM-dependent methyltransferase [Spirosoma sp. SC4-14]|uniref:class I SAM-dependent methyltransferase n=1 Tax=Spirosoma sp. SC4-14 TaxID=3128900 RepID=UPI0030CD83CA
MQYYIGKEENYYINVREDLISLLPNNSQQRVLEIGAGGGDTLVAIKERQLAIEVIGVDLFSLNNTNQTNSQIDQFLIADIEKDDLPFLNGYFDVIICGDVLEHLVDPWLAVEKLSNYLKQGGSFIISVPNIRNYRALFNIVFKGTFAYDPSGGIMDKTHLRFFCRKNVSDLFHNSIFLVKDVLPITRFSKYRFSKKVEIFNFLTFNLLEEFLVSQYLGVAIRK